MLNATRSLLVLAGLALLVACETGSGGILRPDAGPTHGDDVAGQPGDLGGGPGSEVWNPGADAANGPDLPGSADTGSATEGVAALQQATLGIECDPSTAFVNHPGSHTFTGLVVQSPRFEAATDLWGYYVAEASGAWRGVKLVVPADLDGDYQIGDVLTVTGEGVEYYCMTQFKALQAPLVTGQAAVPAAAVVAAETLAPSNAGAEAYEGVRVRLENVHVDATFGWGFKLVEGGVEVSDAFDTDVRPGGGCLLSSLEGVVVYAFEKYQVVPIAAADIVYDPEHESCGGGSATCAFASVSAYQQSPTSAECASDGESFPEGGVDCALSGLVIVSTQIYVSSNLRGHYAMEPAGGPWSGILLKYFKDEAPELAPGDVVDVVGDFEEYFCLSQLDVADPANDLQKTGTTEPPAPVTLADAGALSEELEGVLGVITNQVVAETPSDANHWQVTFTSGIRLDDLASYHYDDFAFTVGQEIASVTGVVTEDTYNRGTYFLLPRGAEDIQPARTTAR